MTATIRYPVDLEADPISKDIFYVDIGTGR